MIALSEESDCCCGYGTGENCTAGSSVGDQQGIVLRQIKGINITTISAIKCRHPQGLSFHLLPKRWVGACCGGGCGSFRVTISPQISIRMGAQFSHIIYIQLSDNTKKECPTVRPTCSEFKDFHTFVEKLQRTYANTYGIVKVVPPEGWKPKKGDYQALNNMMISGPIQQNAYGKGGVYECLHIQKKSMTVKEYKKKIQCFENVTKGLTNEEVEALFWKNLSFSPPLYGADLKLSFMDETAGAWNLNHLNSVLTSSLDRSLPGVNTPYCYIGSWKSLFCWHTEDIQLSAINYLHIGKPKYWYGIRSADRSILENQAKSYFTDNFQRCPDYLRHKTCVINPYILKSKHPKLKIHKMVQNPGEFIMAFGGAYHCGFNSGFNMAEAVNYATYSWLSELKGAKACKCSKDSVQMNQLQIANTLMKSQLRNNPKVVQFYDSLHPKIKKAGNLKKRRSSENTSGDQDSEEYSNKEIQKALRKKLIKKKAKSTVTIKGDQYKIEQWAQCDSCRKWRKVGHKRINKRLPFRCGVIGSNCKSKQQSNMKYISLSS